MENPSGTGLLNPHKKLLLRLSKAQTGEKKQWCVEFPTAAKIKQLPLPASRLPELIGPARASPLTGYDAKTPVSKTECRRYLAIDIIPTKFPEITSDAVCIRGTAIKPSDVGQRLAALGVGRTIEGLHLILPSFPPKSWRLFPTLWIRFYFWTSSAWLPDYRLRHHTLIFAPPFTCALLFFCREGSKHNPMVRLTG